MKINRFFIIIILLLSGIKNYANIDNYQFEYFKSINGLSSNRVKCFMEDSLGFMWIGTNNGLNRFDGTSNKIFTSNETPGSLIHQNINTLEPDLNSPNFWVGTTRGLCLFDFYTYKAKTIPIELDTGLILSNATIMDLEFDKSGSLWIITTNNVFRYDSTLTNFTSNPKKYRRKIKSQFICVHVLPSNKVLIGGQNGISTYNSEKNTIEIISSTKNIGIVSKIYQDSDNDLWVGTMENGAYLYKNGDLNATPIHFSTSNSTLLTNLALDMIEYENRRIFILNKEGGISIYDKARDEFEYIIPEIGKKKGLSTKAILSFGTDSNNNLWIGSYNDGISFLDKHRKPFAHFAMNFGENGLINNNVRSFFEDSKGYIWIGTKENGGLSRFNPNTGKFKHYKADKNNPYALQGDNVTAISEINSRYLLVGTYLNGLHVLDRKTDLFKQYLPNSKMPTAIHDKYITAITKHPNGKILIGTGSGIDLFDFERETFSSFFTENSGRSLYVENSDSIWVGSLKGLYLLSSTGEKIRVYNYKNHYEKKTFPLAVNNIIALNKNVNGNIWVASGYDGLHEMEPNRRFFNRYKYPGSTQRNNVMSMQFDDQGDVWFSSKEGISELQLSTKNFRHFSVLDGLQGEEFQVYASLKTSKGFMLFGGKNGFNMFHPDSIKLNPNPPNVAITDFKIFNKTIDVDSENSPLSHNITHTDTIFLTYDQSYFSFEYVAINYSSSLKNKYAYKMDGVDNDWNYVGNKRTATYTNMVEGDYVFRVKASNNDGVWNEDGCALYIKILPPWWRTTLFRFSMLTLVISLFFGTFFAREQRLKNQQKLLQVKVAERTKQLAQKNDLLEKQAADLSRINNMLEERQKVVNEQAEELSAQAEILSESNKELTKLNATKDKFFSIIAHDLRNPFSIILGFCDILLNDYKSIDDKQRIELIEAIDNSSKRIYKLLENLLHWARSQSKSIKITIKKISPYSEIMNIKDLVNNSLENKNLKMEVNIPKSLEIDSDPNLFEAIFRNFIANSIKFSANGILEVFSEELPETIKISVKDCGVGMSQEAVDNLFKSQYTNSTLGTMGETGTGIGLVICKEFIALLGGNLSVKSKPGEGSTFIVEVPKKITT